MIRDCWSCKITTIEERNEAAKAAGNLEGWNDVLGWDSTGLKWDSEDEVSHRPKFPLVPISMRFLQRFLRSRIQSNSSPKTQCPFHYQSHGMHNLMPPEFSLSHRFLIAHSSSLLDERVFFEVVCNFLELCIASKKVCISRECKVIARKLYVIFCRGRWSCPRLTIINRVLIHGLQ
jgi:hypothetical protein